MRVELATDPFVDSELRGERFVNGTLPPSIGNLSQLGVLYGLVSFVSFQKYSIVHFLFRVLDNVGLFGTLPESRGNLTKPIYRSLSNNSMSGTLPSTLQNLANII